MSLLQQSYTCGAAVKPLIYKTIGNAFEGIVEQYPTNTALVVGHQNIRWDYQTLNKKVDELATGLLAIGIQKGDRVGMWGPNSFEWILTQLATAKIGAILVCINPAYRLSELEYALNKVQCKAIVCAESFKTSNYLDMLNKLAPDISDNDPSSLQLSTLPHLKNIIRLGEESTQGMMNFGTVCGLGTDKEYAELDACRSSLKPDDAINIQFTSGTTGQPKGATLSHFSILNNADVTADCMHFTDQDSLCVPLPLYHCFGMVLSVLLCLTRGAKIVLPAEAFEPLAVLKAVEQERCTALHGVPTMFVMQLDHPEFKNFDISSLRTGIMAGATCPIELMKRTISEMRMSEVLIAYGQTETSPANHITSTEDSLQKRTETVGACMPHMEVKIINENGQVCKIGEQGEICVRGYAVMRGYWQDEEKTHETIDSAGWLHSGDLGVMDEEGYTSITGRIKDMIIRGGENIYPREVEEFLYTHEHISEVQVFGIPDDKLGEEVCAWIQLREGAIVSEQEIKDYCKDQITHFKIPRHIDFVTEFPMTVTGKIQKFKMSEIKQKM